MVKKDFFNYLVSSIIYARLNTEICQKSWAEFAMYARVWNRKKENQGYIKSNWDLQGGKLMREIPEYTSSRAKASSPRYEWIVGWMKYIYVMKTIIRWKIQPRYRARAQELRQNPAFPISFSLNFSDSPDKLHRRTWVIHLLPAA